MSTVLIFGAGATCAEAKTKQVPPKRRPPLDTDFFELCKYHRVVDHMELLRQYLLREYQIDLEAKPPPRMEEVFGLVYADTRMTPVPRNSTEAFIALCRIYNRIILETTNGINPSTRGPNARLIRWALEQGDCTIITFNQDLLLEKTLSVLQPRYLAWFLDSGYGIRFSEYTSRSRRRTGLFRMSRGARSTLQVLKLHGSLNWYVTTRSRAQLPSRMPAGQNIRCTRNRKVVSEMTYSTGGARGRTRWYTWPIIVPPVYEKGAFLSDTLAPVWHLARAAIRNAEQIIVYGYSFPQADQQGRSFFRRARTGNTQLRRVAVINLDPNSATTAYDIFSPPSLLLSSSVRDFLSAGT